LNKVTFIAGLEGESGAARDGAPAYGFAPPEFAAPAVRFADGVTNFTLATPAGARTFRLEGDFRYDQFTPPPDRLPAQPKDDPLCFTEGTLILTDAGEVPVERLAPGARAILHDGGDAKIVFVGQRRVDLSRHPRPEAARPVRIPAGALEDDVPSRELVLSPDHALYLAGALVPVKHLIDGLGVRQDRATGWVRYYHVELEAHGILIAEGTPAASYLDDGNRSMFENGHTAPPARREARPCAPLVTGGAELAAIRTRLFARALMRGYSVAEQALIGLKIGEALIPPDEQAGGRITFRLAQGVTRAVLVSPVFSPAEFDPTSTDRRRLGVALTELIVDGRFMDVERVFNPLDLHRKGLAESAHWTRGPARLTVPAGTREISFKVIGWPKVWRGQ
jgi:hypothetical protein